MLHFSLTCVPSTIDSLLTPAIIVSLPLSRSFISYIRLPRDTTRSIIASLFFSSRFFASSPLHRWIERGRGIMPHSPHPSLFFTPHGHFLHSNQYSISRSRVIALSPNRMRSLMDRKLFWINRTSTPFAHIFYQPTIQSFDKELNRRSFFFPPSPLIFSTIRRNWFYINDK